MSRGRISANPVALPARMTRARGWILAVACATLVAPVFADTAGAAVPRRAAGDERRRRGVVAPSDPRGSATSARSGRRAPAPCAGRSTGAAVQPLPQLGARSRTSAAGTSRTCTARPWTSAPPTASSPVAARARLRLLPVINTAAPVGVREPVPRLRAAGRQRRLRPLRGGARRSATGARATSGPEHPEPAAPAAAGLADLERAGGSRRLRHRRRSSGSPSAIRCRRTSRCSRRRARACAMRIPAPRSCSAGSSAGPGSRSTSSTRPGRARCSTRSPSTRTRATRGTWCGSSSTRAR